MYCALSVDVFKNAAYSVDTVFTSETSFLFLYISKNSLSVCMAVNSCDLISFQRKSGLLEKKVWICKYDDVILSPQKEIFILTISTYQGSFSWIFSLLFWQIFFPSGCEAVVYMHS